MRSLRYLLFSALAVLTAASLAQQPLCDPCFDAPVRNPGQRQLCNPCIDPPVSYPRNDFRFPGETRRVISAEEMRRIGVSSVVNMINQRRDAILGAPPTDCPRTDVSTGPDFRLAGSTRSWYGSATLGVSLTPDSLYSNGAALIWTSDSFRPDMIDEFSVSIRRIGEGPATAALLSAISAQSGDHWQIQTLVRFPDAGCWQISGHFQGQTLIFIAESTDP